MIVYNQIIILGEKQMKNETRIAYAEVDAILNLLESKAVEKIPLKVREFFENEKDKNYIPNINVEISLLEQNLKRETIVLLSILNFNYLCDSEEEKKEILNDWAENEKLKQLEEKELAEKYNPDNLFKKREKLEDLSELAMVEYKEQNFIQKLISKIKNLFKRRN